jgi:hypothetical protein
MIVTTPKKRRESERDMYEYGEVVGRECNCFLQGMQRLRRSSRQQQQQQLQREKQAAILHHNPRRKTNNNDSWQ